MRYFCTIYSHDHTFATRKTSSSEITCGDGTSSDDTADAPLARVLVQGANLREAAARAYVQSVGRERARLLREKQATRRLARQEMNTKAIAASLRKISRSGSSCYLLDNYSEGWYIHVEPVVNMPNPSAPPRRLRLPQSLLLRLARTPLPN